MHIMDDDWSSILSGHPIFAPAPLFAAGARRESTLELSTSTLPLFTNVDPTEDGPVPSGRRGCMALKDADLIVSAGNELRITSLGDAKAGRGAKAHKVLHTPNVQFEIHSMSLNPTGKLLAVAGAFQVAVVVLPRSGFQRLVPTTIDCKSIQVGQFYHASRNAAPIAKIEWHPWGEAGSTLMVMTADGKLREYDISVDTEEPQQTLSFVPDRKAKNTKSFVAEDASEREVASFTLGKGRADWGPLTIYAVMKSGDIYAISPYMPQNASIPSSYIHALECFISAKQEFLSGHVTPKSVSALYDHQRKYITALLKQLPAGTVFPAASRSVLLHPPSTSTTRLHHVRQGPFLLQPSPRLLDGSDGGDATDVTYLAFNSDGSEQTDVEGDSEGGETERLGVMLVVFQDGRVDVCLDVDKAEAQWESKETRSETALPMLAVYETIDLGLISQVGPSLVDLLQGNHPVFLPDPIHDDTIYVYHAFGVHALHLGPMLQTLAAALRADDDGVELAKALSKSGGTGVHPILTTFSVERKCSNPVVAVAVPNDVYLTYSIFIMSSAMRVTTFPLNLRSESPPTKTNILPPPSPVKPSAKSTSTDKWLPQLPGPPLYVSFLKTPFEPAPALVRNLGLPSNPRMATPTQSEPFMLTPDTLRFFGKKISGFSEQIQAVQMGHRASVDRTKLQKLELEKQIKACGELLQRLDAFKTRRGQECVKRVDRVREQQKTLIGRLERQLQTLMDKASPDLSEHETKWFEELKRMKREVTGVNKYDDDALESRTKLLEREYKRLLPGLQDLARKEQGRKSNAAVNRASLGASQAFELGERSNFERLKIGDLEKEITSLASRLEVSLGRAPSQDPLR